MKGVLHAFNKRFSTTASKVATNSSTKIIKKPKFRGMFKFDDYHQIKFDKHWQNRIIERETENLKEWKKMVGGSVEATTTSNWVNKWRRDISKYTNNATNPELYGDYFYTQKAVYQEGKIYYVFYRTNHKTNEEEVILDLRKISQITDPTSIKLENIKISDDHSKVAFLVNMSSSEVQSLGIVDIKSGKILDCINNCAQAQFDKTSEYIYYVEITKENESEKLMKKKIGAQKCEESHMDIHYAEDLSNAKSVIKGEKLIL